jgi:hypothetical protein
MSEYFKYKNYEDYINWQKRSALKTKSRTSRATGIRRRNYLYSRMEEAGVIGSSVLCVGARDDSELDFFKEKGYEADGIDLYSTENIIECDMSKMHEHSYLKDKKYDIVYSNEAMEHCLDFDGFYKGLNLVCSGYFVCMCPVGVPNVWDCARHDFMSNTDDIEKNKEGLEKYFPDFDVILNEVHKAGYRMFFILKRRKE